MLFFTPARSAAGALALGFAAASAAPAQQPPLPPEMQSRANAAVERGAGYLRATQGKWGTWHSDPKHKHAAGYAALPALALLECGARPNDPAVQAAAAFVRYSAANLERTYDTSLAILLLDRLGDPRDKQIIEVLALRLLAGQTGSGGWGYRVPRLSVPQHREFLRALNDPQLTPARVPPFLRGLPVLQSPPALIDKDPAGKTEEPLQGTTDNSNTQFAALALWAAKRHGVPVRRGLDLVALRFAAMQRDDGTWSYRYQKPNADGTTESATCAGLLGLAVGHALAADGVPPEQFKLPAALAASLVGAAEMPNVALAGEVLRRQRGEILRTRARQDPRVVKALQALERYVGSPRGQTENLKMENLYFLWSVERVAVLYDLPRVGGKDWYLWGAEVLLANQHKDGRWDDGSVHTGSPTVGSCFALLFLKRANFVTEVAERLPLAEALGRENPGALPEVIGPRPPVKSDPQRPPPEPEGPPVRDPLPPELPGHGKPPDSGHERLAPRPAPAAPAAPAEPADDSGSSLLGWILGMFALGLVAVPAVLAFRALRGQQDDPDDEEEEDDEPPRRRSPRGGGR